MSQFNIRLKYACAYNYGRSYMFLVIYYTDEQYSVKIKQKTTTALVSELVLTLGLIPVDNSSCPAFSDNA